MTAPTGATATQQVSIPAIVAGLNGRSLVFVGMMGSGKSAVGRLAANALGLPFCDADAEIEKSAGMSVAEIFQQFGEDEFRAGEKKVIARLLAGPQTVLALGGGAFIDGDTRRLVARQAVSIWLKADIAILMARTGRRPGKRPLLQTDDPKKTLLDLLEKREPHYARADLVVETSATTKARTRDKVLAALAGHFATAAVGGSH